MPVLFFDANTAHCLTLVDGLLRFIFKTHAACAYVRVRLFMERRVPLVMVAVETTTHTHKIRFSFGRRRMGHATHAFEEERADTRAEFCLDCFMLFQFLLYTRLCTFVSSTKVAAAWRAAFSLIASRAISNIIFSEQ